MLLPAGVCLSGSFPLLLELILHLSAALPPLLIFPVARVGTAVVGKPHSWTSPPKRSTDAR